MGFRFPLAQGQSLGSQGDYQSNVAFLKVEESWAPGIPQDCSKKCLIINSTVTLEMTWLQGTRRQGNWGRQQHTGIKLVEKTIGQMKIEGSDSCGACRYPRRNPGLKGSS